MPVLDTTRQPVRVIGAVRASEKPESGAHAGSRQTRSDVKC
jgi:hypothetical protein